MTQPSFPCWVHFLLEHIEVRTAFVKTSCSESHSLSLVLVQSPIGSSSTHIGIISDRRLLAYFASFARPQPTSPSSSPVLASPISVRSASFNSPTSSFLRYLNNPLSSLSLPSLNLYSEVVAVTAGDTVLNAMKVMSELGVSSVAVVHEDTGNLLSAVSVTDIGKVSCIDLHLRH